MRDCKGGKEGEREREIMKKGSHSWSTLLKEREKREKERKKRKERNGKAFLRNQMDRAFPFGCVSRDPKYGRLLYLF